MQFFPRYFEIITKWMKITDRQICEDQIVTFKQSHILLYQGLLFLTRSTCVIVDARSHTCKSHDFIPRYDIIYRTNALWNIEFQYCVTIDKSVSDILMIQNDNVITYGLPLLMKLSASIFATTANIRRTNSNNVMLLVSSCTCLYPIHWSQVLRRGWRCN